MPLLMALPLNAAIALLIFSVLGTLTGIWIAVALLRRGGIQRLSGFLITNQFLSPTTAERDLTQPDSDSLARGLLDLVAAQSGCRFAALFLPKVRDDCLEPVLVEGDSSGWQAAEIPYAHSLVRRMMQEAEPLLIRVDRQDSPLPDLTTIFPVLSRGHLIGAIAAGPTESGRAISRRSLRALTNVVEQSTASLENVQLYRSLRQAFTEVEDAQRELLALQRVSVAAQSSLRLDQVLSQIVQGVTDSLAFDLAVVYLADLQNRTISMPVRSPADPGRVLKNDQITLDESNPTTRAMLADEVLVTHDIQESLLPKLIEEDLVRPNEVVADSTVANLPLVSKGQVIGGMVLATRRPAFSAVELDSLKSFAAQAAATISNARLYEELERAYRDARTAEDQLLQAERLRTLGQVASGVAHDFNNILTAILNRAQLARLQTRTPDLRESLSVIEQAALDGSNVVRRIQSLARPHEERTPEAVNLGDVIQRALEFTRPMWSNVARAHGVAIAEEAAFAPEIFIDGNPSELREVFTNLILNATAAMPAGGTLRLRCEFRDNSAWCSVEDTGTGMPEDVRLRVFEPFFSTKGEAGSGLGMSIVAAIVQRHAGTIEIDTQPGQGTRVQMYFPKSSGKVVQIRDRRQRGRVSLRILLTEEDDVGRSALELLLSRNGHRVSTASTAEDAVRLLVEQEYDVVLTELALGPHSGWEVAEAAKVIRPAAAVVLTTAWTADWDSAELRQRGVDAVLSKPYTVDQIHACLEQALTLSG
jgi:signal transduction histidine kinase/CheY-like chemotaxis protein